MVDGMIDAATVIDAQINYGIRLLKSTLKLGASNIAGKEYGQVLGAGLMVSSILLLGQSTRNSLIINSKRTMIKKI
jgi:hypothetical protein